MAPWEEQAARVERYFVRIQNRERERAEYEDDLWSFFQNCWHLKDWVYHDATLPHEIRQSIVKDVQQSNILLICRDLANRSKHFNLRDSSFDATLFGEAEIDAGDSRYGEVSASRVLWDYMVEVNGNYIRALDIASVAVEEWRQLLRRLGLKRF